MVNYEIKQILYSFKAKTRTIVHYTDTTQACTVREWMRTKYIEKRKILNTVSISRIFNATLHHK